MQSTAWYALRFQRWFAVDYCRCPCLPEFVCLKVTISLVAALGYCAQDGGEEPEVDCIELTRALDRLGLGTLQRSIDRRMCRPLDVVCITGFRSGR